MKAIIFDFDGVLVDSYNFNRGIVSNVGHKVSEEDFKAHHDGNVFEEPKIPFTEKTAGDFYNKYLKEIHTQSPVFSLEEIRSLNSKFYLFIISSNGESGIEKFLLFHRLDYFDEVLGAKFHKSKVEKFKYLFKKYNLKADECVFISDTLGDILEGHKVGIRTIAVDFGFHDRKRLEKGNPFKIVSSFDEMLKVIENM